MLCWFQVYNKVKKSQCTYICSFQILFPYRLLHSIEQITLFYIVGPCYLAIVYIQQCSYVSPNPPVYPSPTHISPLVTGNFVSKSLSLFYDFFDIFYIITYNFPCISDHIYLFFSVWLTKPSIIISRSIYIAENSIIFFLWLNSI